jgi:hypothetical protein
VIKKQRFKVKAGKARSKASTVENLQVDRKVYNVKQKKLIPVQ